MEFAERFLERSTFESTVTGGFRFVSHNLEIETEVTSGVVVVTS